MVSLRDALDAATGEGIVSPAQAGQLLPFLEMRGIAGTPAIVSTGASDMTDARLAEDSEQPRFIRGFHDILITIGVVVALVGLWGLGSFFAALPAIVILSEILIRRQRLALPAVALTIALVQWIAVVMALVLDGKAEIWGEYASALVFVAAFPVVLGLFYWRYRVPLSLSLLLLSLYALVVTLVLTGLGRALGSTDLLTEHWRLSTGILLVGALAVFSTALAYDLSDPKRLTRRSDIAFWLHLAAAPAMLYALLAFVFFGTSPGNWWGEGASFGNAVAVVAVVALLMITGIVLDRRAFVTSGLLSLGYAIWTILNQAGAALQSYFFVTVLAVGVVVLVIGVFWQPLRRAVVGQLPQEMRTRLHPVD